MSDTLIHRLAQMGRVAIVIAFVMFATMLLISIQEGGGGGGTSERSICSHSGGDPRIEDDCLRSFGLGR